MNLLYKTIGLFFLMEILSTGYSEAATHYYRSMKSGFWKDATSWEIADDATFTVNVLNATSPPDCTSEIILIKSGHVITIDQSVTIDETVVEIGAMLIYGNYSSSVLSVNDGIGIDLQINGTIEDSGPFNINWSTIQSSWALGMSATMIRIRSTSAALWRDHYEGGMSTIPVGSTWIIRKQGADNPSISAINSYYGNLKIENTTSAFWNATVVGSKFIGTASAAVIKGTMEIGAPGFYGVKFYSQNSATNLILIKGNLLVNQGSEINLEDASTTTGASGINLQGDLIVDGILSYGISDASDNNRIIKFTGATNQTISGAGVLLMYNLVNDKLSGDLILNRSIAIDNKVTLTNGKLDLNKNILFLQNNSVEAIGRANGWIRSEATDNASKVAWNIGSTNGVYEFPFGKNSISYIPFSIYLTAGDIGIVSVSTYGTTTDNLPLPTIPELVTNIDVNGINNSAYTVDRFWQIDKTGTSGTATLSFSYSSGESPPHTSVLVGRRYATVANSWESPACCQIQDLTNCKVTIPNVSYFSTWTLMEKNDALPLSMDVSNNQSNTLVEKTDVSICPVPFRETFFVNYSMEEKYAVSIEVYTSLGVKLFSKNVDSDKGDNCFEVNLSSEVAQGIIYVRFMGEKTAKTFTVLRE